ncbi:MAG: Sua5/YciO/YrdC/YwlC family protein [candidate division TA06 bacterium 32_111]|uniref:L-threonylcarbamoyladenylate synthase n=2 Tax=Bacteria candidate phyla TaxID=1783234 RepID=A0A101I2W4_UNCT6|nr:MAG: Sua5/YciO/YrdC/YwlC family protein [candidate division TA06 bacterium 32_111]KUK87374.1 MAG: Sua5/YciO/YrdC/YwlC family protein [candidate division TA06 bacterium 34_109]HAF07792.1 threonylcarbamoyl-AMP synthase [candidate division WOR-3 bacterium]HCP17310.1 threonylcarbamoyl-AMP synthase [candidate division WOR-3 bacterium]
MRKKDYEEALNILKEGRLLAFSTDTINGIATSFDNIKGIEKIFHLKKRDFKKPFALFFSENIEIENFFYTSKLFWKIKEKFLPGQLTIVLKAKKIIPSVLVKDGFASLRIPDEKKILKLIDLFKKPLACTSLNISGKDLITEKDEFEKYFKGVHLFGELKKKKKPSTVIKIDKKNVEILREGGIEKEKILKFINKESLC